jgi:hypothetical protein
MLRSSPQSVALHTDGILSTPRRVEGQAGIAGRAATPD